MSTVLWANQLLNGQVLGENEDYYALYRHVKRLDAICTQLKLRTLTSFCDLTDVQFNHDDDMELPPGATSTNDIMKVSGVWIDGGEAHDILSRLLAHLRKVRPRFGLLSNDLDDVIAELEASVKFAESASRAGAMFNFSIVE